MSNKIKELSPKEKNLIFLLLLPLILIAFGFIANVIVTIGTDIGTHLRYIVEGSSCKTIDKE